METISYTEDFAKFGHRERELASELLIQWNKGNLPEDFEQDGIKFAFNMNSGNVFLTNSNFDCAMMNGETLESFYSTPYEGIEGFFSELVEEFEEMHEEDKEYMFQIAENINSNLLDKYKEEKQNEKE